MYEKDRHVIELKSKMVVLVAQPFDGDIDTDSLVQIDYANILGEILTFPVLFNRIANLKAEVASLLSHAKLDFDVFEAQMFKEYQDKLLASGERKPTNKDIEASIIRDVRYQTKKKQLIAREKDFAILEALYWSAQSKDTKLNRLSEKIRPEDFESDILEGTINNVMIKMTRKAIQ